MMMDKRLFAIIFVGRQGSSYLQGILDSHPNARCFGEILVSNGLYDAGGYDDLFRFLEEVVHPNPESAIGFKMPLASLEAHPNAWDTFHHFGYRMIHLTRKNKLDQFISMRLAQINGTWSSEMGEMTTFRIRCTPDELRFSFRTWIEQDAFLRKSLSRFSTFHMTYEDLTQPCGYKPVLEFLDLETIELFSRFKKQRSGTQAEIIENYGELKTHFSETEFSCYFVD